MKHFFSSLAVAAMAAMANAEQEAPSFYAPGESQGSFDFVMKPYPIPIKTTTYVDFFFNLPDDLPELFHIVMGEVIVSQPLHLHHFVLTGCPEKVDESVEGLPFEFDIDNLTFPECTIPLGGWAPGGDVFQNIDLNTGVLMGKGTGVQAVQLNVHYTDGAYEDAATQTPKMATDGIRVHYTTDFRPYTSVSKPVINIGLGTEELSIPPGEERFFVSHTCKVGTSCKDVDPEILQYFASVMGDGVEGAPAIPDDLSCPMVKPFCNMGGELGTFVQMLCPVSCGYCDKVEGQVNPFNPDSYRVTGVNYHAHLLGREMYTTLLREVTSEPNVAIQKAAPAELMIKDLKSAEFWIYDFQETVAFDYEDIIATDGTNEILRGTEIRPGDKIQATCVYDSSYREEPTRFGLSTYDEMCITILLVNFETPASLLNSGGNVTQDTLSDINLRTELALVSFSCESDDETDIYTGTLAPGEDGRDIWKNHPLEAAEGCTFPTSDILGIGASVFRVRNCPVVEGEVGTVCEGLENVSLLNNEIAGADCSGGTLDGKDSNDGITEAECLEGGGAWAPYTCQEADSWLESSGLDEVSAGYLKEFWWQPKCCGDASSLDTEESDSSSEDLESSDSNADSGASTFATSSMALGLLSVVAAMIL